ncbi:hypothetical protein ACOSP7_026727 [Xanthoceras sorbifolium]
MGHIRSISDVASNAKLACVLSKPIHTINNKPHSADAETSVPCVMHSMKTRSCGGLTTLFSFGDTKKTSNLLSFSVFTTALAFVRWEAMGMSARVTRERTWLLRNAQLLVKRQLENNIHFLVCCLDETGIHTMVDYLEETMVQTSPSDLLGSYENLPLTPLTSPSRSINGASSSSELG